MKQLNQLRASILLFVLLLSSYVFAQKSVAGIVNGENNQPLAGVTVTEKGTKNRTLTDERGMFSIRNVTERSILVFSYTGYAPLEITAGSRSDIIVTLKLAQNLLDDVVVVGYGTRKKVTNVGSQASISTKELVQSPTANISNSLVGRMPGLFAVQTSGEPGNDQSSLRIRGVGTFSGNASPLILVDGLQVDNYNNIDPNEIETVTILKDASSTAVYGIRGANGVLIITTKRGRSGKPTVGYTFNNAFNSFTNFREMMNAVEFATAYNQAEKNDAYINGSVITTPRFTDDAIKKYASGADPIFFPNVNWVDLMVKDVSMQQQHNLNIRGGTDKVKYFISAGYFNQEGLFNNTDLVSDFDAQPRFKRYNFRSNFNFDITKRFRAALDVSNQTENRTGNAADTRTVMNWLLSANPLGSPGIVDGKLVTLTPSTAQGGNISNPLTFLFTSGYKADYRNYLNSSIRLDHDLDFITKGLSTHGIVAYQNFNRQYEQYTRPLVTYQAHRLPDNTELLAQQADNTAFSYSSLDPNSASNMRNRRTTIEFALDYKRSFGPHNISALALYNQQKNSDPDYAFRVANGYQSYVGRMVYDYKGRYLAEISGAYNGTENFAPGNRFGLFPSYAIGWVPSQENFFPKNDIVTFVKIRATYGEVGNDQLSGNFLEDPLARFLYRPTSFSSTGPYSGSGYYFWGVVGNNYISYPGIREGRASNPNLTWERAIKKNIGLELQLWRSKISLTADVFQEDRDNILTVPQTISGIVGNSLPAQNIGSMSNKGFEVDLTYRDRLRSFNYWVKANYSFARNKVLFQDEITRAFPYQQRTGQRFGQLFGLIAEGYYNTWEEVNDPTRPSSTYVGNNRVQPGDVKYRDVNGDGILDNDDMVPLGNPVIPEKIFGFSLGGEYKGFDFSILFQGATNVSMQYARRAFQAFHDVDLASAPRYLLESWTADRYAQGLPIRFPRFSIGNGAFQTHNYQSSNLWIVDGSYLRLKNAEIGFTLRPKFLRRVGLSSARIYANGNNLLTWSDLFPGIDPETPNLSSQGVFEPYPVVRTINAGININF